MLRLPALVVASSIVTALVAGCGSSRNRFDQSPSATDPGSSGGTSGSLGNNTGEEEPPPTGEQCAAQSVSANRAEVDIVVIIDTSGSMSEETAQVQQNINSFAQKIGGSGLDYTVVMIAEKPFTPPFPLPIPVIGICVPPPLGGANCADNPPKFHHINEGVGSFDSLQILLDLYPQYAPWLRKTAYKVFIEVTDDNSNLGWQDFDAQLLAKATDQFGTSSARRYIFNSICGWQKGSAVLSGGKCGTAENTGDQYQHLSQLTGGTVASVCESDYSGVFDNIAKGLITKLGCEFAYPVAEPGKQTDPNAVVVNYTPPNGAPTPLTRVTDASKCDSVTDGWHYDDNANPSRIIFCPTTCQSAGSDTGGKLDIAVGCLAPPPK